jgi:GNAT superfamily N-acetyltransferase
VDRDQVRAVFDAQVRRSTVVDQPGVAAIEAGHGVLRTLTVPGEGMSAITWSGLDETTADQVIAAEIEYFRARGEPVEWKLFDYDKPPDLGQRLARAGFAAQDEELMLVAETERIGLDVVVPDGVRIAPVADAAGVAALVAVHQLEPGSAQLNQMLQRMLGQLRDARGLSAMVVAMAGDEPVGSARIEFMPGTDFAGLWGAATVPAWRGRGVFRALVAYRAGLAAACGYRYLLVDTSVMSRPILTRLGFEPIAWTTPYLWEP